MGFHEQDKGSRGESLGFLFYDSGAAFQHMAGPLLSRRFLAGVFAVLMVCGLAGSFSSGVTGPVAAPVQEAYTYSLSELRQMARKESDALNGAPAELVRSLFDSPELVRSDDPVTVWQYRTATCVMDVYLNMDEAHTPRNVLYAEVRGRDPEAAEVAWGECVPTLLERPLRFAALDSG